VTDGRVQTAKRLTGRQPKNTTQQCKQRQGTKVAIMHACMHPIYFASTFEKKMACMDSDSRDADNNNDSFEFESTNNDDYSSYWKNIPDPPMQNEGSTAPSIGVNDATAGLRRHHHRGQERRRRHSFAFRDVTNHTPTILKCDSKNDVSIIEKKSSTSLFPSSAGDEDDPLCTNLQRDDTNGSRERKKKRLRRQTMLLFPRDNRNLVLFPMDFGASAQSLQREDNTTSKVGNNSTEKNVVQLVRKFFSLPHENRIEVAQEIESLSGYPMPGYVMSGYTRSKEAFILKVQPIVQALEDRKQLDVLEAEEFTQCHVVKVDKEGFCYYDVSTGEQIEAREYKLRYAAMLDEKRQKRKEMAKIKDEYESCRQGEGIINFCHPDSIQAVVTTKEGGASDSNDDGRSNENETDRQESVDDSNMDIEGLSMDESIMSPEESVLIGTDETSSTVVRDTSLSDEDSLSNNIKLSIEGKSNNGAGDESGQPEIKHYHDHLCSPQQHTAGLAELPSSNNSRVLAARTKLWLAIDAALAAYSKEIIEIQGGCKSSN
jgi:hypothetical protein